MSKLHTLGVAEQAALLRERKVSAVELAQHHLQRIEVHRSLGAFLDLNPEVTLAQAKAADARLAKGEQGPLLGVPVAHKDIFATKDFVTTAGSKMLAGYRSPFDATVVAKLGVEQAGMVTLGKLNCDEFAMGGSNENSAYGPTHNPWDTARISGGSSGGTAVAVAAGLAPAATGTDTGGSVRQPASFCGVTGIKPTYGRASRFGMVAFASSLDQAGVMARSAADCAVLLTAMCGPDLDRDSTSLDVPAEEYSRDLVKPIKGLRIGVPKEFFGDGVEPGVRAATEAALNALKDQGAELVSISLPRTELSIPVYYLIAPAEASSNLSRFDGVKFGHRTADPADLMDLYKRSRAEGFGPEVKRRIMIGSYVLSHGYYDAYYVKAQQIRRLITDDFAKAFTQCDVIAGPVAPTVARSLGSQSDPVAEYLADIFTLPASLAGLPGLSQPCGFGEHGMPVGLQLIGNHLQEATLLRVAHQYQLATDFHRQIPKGFA